MNKHEMIISRNQLLNYEGEFPVLINGHTVISVDQMRQADLRTIKNGTPSKELMFRAGVGLYWSLCNAYTVIPDKTVIKDTDKAYQAFLSGNIKELTDKWLKYYYFQEKPNVPFKHVAIVAGSGNNAGDGYVLAMLLNAAGVKTTIVRLKDKCSEDGQFFFDQCVNIGIANMLYEQKDLSSKNPHGFDCVVDCIFGTGFKGDVKDLEAEAIEAINSNCGTDSSRWFVLSCDINSGLNGNTGESELCVHSNLTVSIGYYKPGHFLGVAPNVVDRMTNINIGIELPL